MIKACLDANVFISAAIFDGKPEEILRLAQEGKIKLVISPSILAEVTRILIDKFQREEEEIILFVKLLSDISEIVQSKKKFHKINYDPDNRILKCALDGDVDYIVSGDKKHLLPLKKFNNVLIVPPAKFLERLILPS